MPLVLLFFVLALLLVAGTVAASAAFLAQRDLQSDCDGAAVVAANALDAAGFYGSDRAGDALPLAVGGAQAAVDRYAADAGAGQHVIRRDGRRLPSPGRLCADGAGPVRGGLRLFAGIAPDRGQRGSVALRPLAVVTPAEVRAGQRGAVVTIGIRLCSGLRS